jgi:hypothetical protein
MSKAMQDNGRIAAQLATPLGEPGSGRQRYGAAMALYQAGQLSAQVLEVYRICSPRDGDDPVSLIRARGLKPPDPIQTGPRARIAALVDEIDLYLSSLDGPGIAEVRSGIATWRGNPIGGVEGWKNPVVADHLSAALAPLQATHPALARAIAEAAPDLDWHHFSDYPAADIGEAFLSGNAYCTLIGESGPIRAEGFDLGLFLIAPHLLYRDRHHKAPELYVPLTGPHGWRFVPGGPLSIRQAHEPVWNEPFVPHLTKVGPVPFLSLFGWTQDVNDPPHVLPADDWNALEALRLPG